MEMEMEVTPAPEFDHSSDLAALEGATLRLNAAAALLEGAASRLTEINISAASRVPADARDLTCVSALEEKLVAAEATIASLRAEASARTRPAHTVSSLVAKHTSPTPADQPGALDAALRSLSLEQRIAVKSELLRAGLLT